MQYDNPVPVEKILEDLHEIPVTQSILIIGPPGIGKSEGIKQFALNEAITLAKDIETKFKKSMNFLILDNPEGVFKSVVGIEKTFPSNSVIFIDTTKTGAVIDNRLLNEFVNELIERDNLVYMFVDIRLSEVEPPDLVGLPSLVQGDVPGIYYSNYASNVFVDALSIDKSARETDEFKKEIRKVHGILFLDEFTNIQRADVLSMAFKIVLDRMIGFKKISSGVRIIAAGNHQENSQLSRELPSPLVNRFLVIKAKAPSVDSWRDYMLKRINEEYKDQERRDVLKSVVNLLTMFFKDEIGKRYFLDESIPPKRLEPFPTPRSWTNAVFTIGNCNEINENCFKFFSAAVGTEATYEFLNWLKNSGVPCTEEMLDYSIEQLGEYLKKHEVYKNVKKFAYFMNSYELLVKDKSIWDHNHDLKRFFSNLIFLVNEHKNEIQGDESTFQEYIRLIALGFKNTAKLVRRDQLEIPLFKTISNDINYELSQLFSDVSYSNFDKKLNYLKEKVSKEPVYCLAMLMYVGSLERIGYIEERAKYLRDAFNSVCSNYVPMIGVVSS